jgi:very-short-patch-repair endonuclease
VVTFNLQQQDLIEKLLEAKQNEHPEIEPYFSVRAPERLFVKNLENVQGDERDVMIFSTTFGKDPAGKLSMNFGPMNKPGGERRLNVAITRARERLIVVTSLDPEEIDLKRTAAVGIKHLREFLEFARDGKQALLRAVTTNPDLRCESPFEIDVLNVCQEALHWKMETQVGCSGYRIDLAVVDPRAPGRYLLGIECDGATYHSGATARDRDRLRQSVLEGLGWTFHRIWSTDWRLNRSSEIERLQKAYERALAMPPRPGGKGTNSDLRSEVEAMMEAQPPRPAPVVAATPKSRTPIEAVDPKEVSDDDRQRAILQVLKDSGAIPRAALVQAAANGVGHRRVGTRIRTAFERVLSELLEQRQVREIGDRLALP